MGSHESVEPYDTPKRSARAVSKWMYRPSRARKQATIASVVGGQDVRSLTVAARITGSHSAAVADDNRWEFFGIAWTLLYSSFDFAQDRRSSDWDPRGTAPFVKNGLA